MEGHTINVTTYVQDLKSYFHQSNLNIVIGASTIVLVNQIAYCTVNIGTLHYVCL